MALLPAGTDRLADESVVEAVLGSRRVGSSPVEYLIKWAGFDRAEKYTWELETHLDGGCAKLVEFKASQIRGSSRQDRPAEPEWSTAPIAKKAKQVRHKPQQTEQLQPEPQQQPATPQPLDVQVGDLVDVDRCRARDGGAAKVVSDLGLSYKVKYLCGGTETVARDAVRLLASFKDVSSGRASAPAAIPHRRAGARRATATPAEAGQKWPEHSQNRQQKPQKPQKQQKPQPQPQPQRQQNEDGGERSEKEKTSEKEEQPKALGMSSQQPQPQPQPQLQPQPQPQLQQPSRSSSMPKIERRKCGSDPQLVADVREYMRVHKVSQCKVGLEARISQPVISNWLSMKYEGYNHKVDAALRQWLAMRKAGIEVFHDLDESASVLRQRSDGMTVAEKLEKNLEKGGGKRKRKQQRQSPQGLSPNEVQDGEQVVEAQEMSPVASPMWSPQPAAGERSSDSSFGRVPADTRAALLAKYSAAACNRTGAAAKKRNATTAGESTLCPWTDQEDADLKALVCKEGTGMWQQKSALHNANGYTRTADALRQRYGKVMSAREAIKKQNRRPQDVNVSNTPPDAQSSQLRAGATFAQQAGLQMQPQPQPQPQQQSMPQSQPATSTVVSAEAERAGKAMEAAAAAALVGTSFFDVALVPAKQPPAVAAVPAAAPMAGEPAAAAAGVSLYATSSIGEV
jgi:hypothetical protein